MGERVRLDGWKAIAEHMGRTVRTVQRWHRDRQLPVHRVAGGKVGAVFAFVDDLDAWFMRQRDVDDPESTAGDGVQVDTVARGAGNTRPWLTYGAIAVAVVGMVAAAVYARVGARHVAPVRARIDGDRLDVWDVQGRIAWSHTFPVRLQPPAALRVYDPHRDDTVVADIDGDGKAEVVAMVASESDTQSDLSVYDVYCFASDGSLRWRYRPEVSLPFNGRRFDGPWVLASWMVGRTAATRGLWLAFSHGVWWPSFLVRLQKQPDTVRKYVSSGVMYRLDEIQAAGRTFIVAAGVNNGYAAASLAFLDPDAAPSSSPQSPGPFQCDACPPPGPFRMYLFPPTEITGLRHLPYNAATMLKRVRDGMLVWTAEDITAPYTQLIYHVSPSLDIDGYSRTDGYTGAHREFERLGFISHSLEHCPEGRGINVKVWEQKTGWREVVVPLAPPS